MIEIVLNGEKKQLKNPQTLQALLTDIGFASSYAAVAVNKSIIDHSAYDTTQIKQGDEIDILTPMQGG